jgi:hypothetical protein
MSNNPTYPDPSLELILVNLAKTYAPRLVPPDWQKPGDLKRPLHIMARQLANYHVLVSRQSGVGGYPSDSPGVRGTLFKIVQFVVDLRISHTAAAN